MNILLFGITRDIIGESSLSFAEEESKPSTVGELKQLLGTSYPKLNSLSSLAVAVNNSYAEDGQVLNEKDEIAIIPPVSGG